MKRKSRNSRVYVPDDPDNWLARDGVYGKSVLLGSGADPGEWREITPAEYAAALAEEGDGL